MRLHLGEVACGVVDIAFCAVGFGVVWQDFHEIAVGIIDVVPKGFALLRGQQLVGGIVLIIDYCLRYFIQPTGTKPVPIK